MSTAGGTSWRGADDRGEFCFAETALITLPPAGLTLRAAHRGEYLAFLDDDDAPLPDHLSTTLAGMGGAGVDLVYSSCRPCRGVAVVRPQ
jgi:hypothetical protein